MAKSIKGSAIFGEDGTYIFTPYSQGQPENVAWLPLATVKNGKLDCSKKKIRMVLTMERSDLPLVLETFTKAFGQLSKAFIDRKVERLYKAAAKEKPCEIKETQPEQGSGERTEQDEPARPFAYD